MRIGTWVHTWLVYERASIYIIRKSRLGDWRYIVERSRVQKFLKIYFFLKGNFFLMEMNGRKNFYDGSRARATLAPSLSGLECYFFFIIRKIEFSLYIKINIFYMRIGTWLYTWLVFERASLDIIRKSRLGDWRYIVERSRVKNF